MDENMRPVESGALAGLLLAMFIVMCGCIGIAAFLLLVAHLGN
jgi:hypothetical protein